MVGNFLAGTQRGHSQIFQQRGQHRAGQHAKIIVLQYPKAVRRGLGHLFEPLVDANRPLWGRETPVDVVRVARVGGRLVGRTHVAARRILDRRILHHRDPAAPVVGGIASVEQEFALLFPFQRKLAVDGDGDVLAVIGKDEVLRRADEVRQRLAVIVVVAGDVEFVKSAEAVAWLVAYPLRGQRRTCVAFFPLVVHNGSVVGVNHIFVHGIASTLHRDHFQPLAGFAPGVIVPVFGVGRVAEFYFVQIQNVRVHVGNAPGHVLVEANHHTRNTRQRNAVHIHIGRVQLHLVPDGGQRQFQMRVVGQYRVARGRLRRADRPVVAAQALHIGFGQGYSGHHIVFRFRRIRRCISGRSTRNR